MKKNNFIKLAQKAALINKKNRKDPRYLRVMGFLAAKGLLYTNQQIINVPNARIDIADAIWAGHTVEPRILEVLPAAVLRLPKHFNFNPEAHFELRQALHALKHDLPGDFFGIDINKLKPWLNIKLKDGRTKKMADKKIAKTFRLRPETVRKIKELKKQMGKSEAEIIEDLIG